MLLAYGYNTFSLLSADLDEVVSKFEENPLI